MFDCHTQNRRWICRRRQRTNIGPTYRIQEASDASLQHIAENIIFDIAAAFLRANFLKQLFFRTTANVISASCLNGKRRNVSSDVVGLFEQNSPHLRKCNPCHVINNKTGSCHIKLSMPSLEHISSNFTIRNQRCRGRFITKIPSHQYSNCRSKTKIWSPILLGRRLYIGSAHWIIFWTLLHVYVDGLVQEKT